jgi:nicotinamidase-related amidase
VPTMEIQATPAPVEIDPARTAVIVIDMQNAFGSPGGMFDKAGIGISRIQAAVAPTRAAVEAARRARMKIVYLKMGFLSDLSDLGSEDVPNGHLFLHLGVKDGVLARDELGHRHPRRARTKRRRHGPLQDSIQRLLSDQAG